MAFTRATEMSTFYPLADEDTISESVQLPEKTEMMMRQACLPLQPEDLCRMAADMKSPMLQLLKEKMEVNKIQATVGDELLSYLKTYLGFEPNQALRFSSPEEAAKYSPDDVCAKRLQGLNLQPEVVDPASLELCVKEKRVCPALSCLTQPACSVEVANHVFDLQKEGPANPFQDAVDSMSKGGDVFPLLLASCLTDGTLAAQDNPVTYFEVPEPGALCTSTSEFKIRICTVGNPAIENELRALLAAGRPVMVEKGSVFTVAEQLLVLASYVSWMNNSRAERPSGSLTDSSEDVSQNFDILAGLPDERAPSPRHKSSEQPKNKYFQFSEDGVQLPLPPETRALLTTALENGKVELTRPTSIPAGRSEEPACLYTCVVAAIVPRTESTRDRDPPALNQNIVTTTISISCAHGVQQAPGAGSLCDGCLQRAVAHASSARKEASGSRSLCDGCLQKFDSNKLPGVYGCQHSDSAPAFGVPRSVSIPTCGKCKKAVAASFSGGSWCRECKHGAAEISLCKACTNAVAAGSVSLSVCDACKGAAAAGVACTVSVSGCKACTKAMASAVTKSSFSVAPNVAGRHGATGSLSLSLCMDCQRGLTKAAAAAEPSCGSLCIPCTKAMAGAAARSSFSVAPNVAGQHGATGSFSLSLCVDCQNGMKQAAAAGSESVSLCIPCTKAMAGAVAGSESVSLCIPCTKVMAGAAAQSVSGSLCVDCQNGMKRAAAAGSESVSLCIPCTKAMAGAAARSSFSVAGQHGATGSLSLSLCVDCQRGLTKAAAPGSESVSLCIPCTKAMASAAAQSVSGSLCEVCTKALNVAVTTGSESGSVCDVCRGCVSVSISCDVCAGKEVAASNATDGKSSQKTSVNPRTVNSVPVKPRTEGDKDEEYTENSSECFHCGGNPCKANDTAGPNANYPCFESFEVPLNFGGQGMRRHEGFVGTCFDSFEVPRDFGGQEMRHDEGTCVDSISFGKMPQVTNGRNEIDDQQQKTSGQKMMYQTSSAPSVRDHRYKMDEGTEDKYLSTPLF